VNSGGIHIKINTRSIYSCSSSHVGNDVPVRPPARKQRGKKNSTARKKETPSDCSGRNK
jgi:hypothetical protein